MKALLLHGLLALATAATAAPLDSHPPAALSPLTQQAPTAYLAAQLVTMNHYQALPLDDALSARIFDQFVKALDPQRIFFVEADIAQLGRFRLRLDDAILDEDLSAPFAIFNLCTRRAYQRLSYARSLLAAGFDFSRKEHYQYDRENGRRAAWPKSEREVRELWRQRVKNDWLRLKLAGKDAPAIVDILERRYAQAEKRIARLRSEDVFEKFMNAYLGSIEPHSDYLGPQAATELDIALRLSLVGVGTTVSEKNDYITIIELTPGGPASLSGQLRVGDRIVGAAQGENGPMTEIIGWRLADAAPLIRGAAGSLVRLEVLPGQVGPDGPTHVVSLVRRKIGMADEAARSTIIPVAQGTLTRRIGVIELPAFYADFAAQQKGDPGFKSASRDVAMLLAELKAQSVDAVLIDLRDNGGGSISEAIELTRLFIDQGPVVQQRDAHGDVSVAHLTLAGVAWDGPLGLLINRRSASAAEIFAAAIQDYQRGLLIGEASFGKGTAQTLIDLDQLAHNDRAKFGELKLTVAQIFRINGESTQLRGVTPDISFPHLPARSSAGESSLDHALPWRQLKAVDFSPAAGLKALRPILLARHQARVRNDLDFQLLREDLAELERWRTTNQVSLNEAERRKENEAQQTRQRSRSERRNTAQGVGASAAPGADTFAVTDSGLLDDEEPLPAPAGRKARDFFLIEAARIVGDEVDLLESPRARPRG
jgi:carboxyl-terminal processing protease